MLFALPFANIALATTTVHSSPHGSLHLHDAYDSVDAECSFPHHAAGKKRWTTRPGAGPRSCTMGLGKAAVSCSL
ncbi:hypothetical protein CMEL01_13028 [Colletotrichum melonis]|uniref:Uncharacterized protein n=1 Tax=Colletotrichum melonis TaxID=1209925 RepID=A0AAI9UT58_9PEZI|nr:hypothetical protein CMEL01_13028 [Colletotrichum melonis]